MEEHTRLPRLMLSICARLSPAISSRRPDDPARDIDIASRRLNRIL